MWVPCEDRRVIYQSSEDKKRERLLLERMFIDGEGSPSWQVVTELDMGGALTQTIMQMYETIKGLCND